MTFYTHWTFLLLFNNKSKTVGQNFIAWTENFHNKTRGGQKMAGILLEREPPTFLREPTLIDRKPGRGPHWLEMIIQP